MTLEAHTVQVWRASLNRPDSRIDEMFATLTEDERRRAQRFHFEEDRRRFIAGRGILRALIGGYLGMAPAAVRFEYNLHGKPFLSDNQAPRFNVSHSGGLALYAFAVDREVGVDVERVRPEFADEAVAQRFFSPQEVAVLRNLAPRQRVEAFFSCWTRKEAYIKARGKGLAIPLDQFDVSLAPDEPAAVLADRDAPSETGRWAMWRLEPGIGFAGAVAVEGQGCRLKSAQWPDERAV
jgi:4'-phosphopantetheinyl transferase